ncbi:SDR family NAD(P)-dependent oxidoreductase [Namhaeicola litoreus]|uniref:SDR family NAD(P)-dependent oxidoreductase n=1 Tax=Namhaeicola litoreus TaxID=1052145 RepID=A0ABW3Y152_9FLAO
MTKTVFITGATSGIGKATAEVFAQNGWDLIIVGRRGKRLYDLQDHLRKAYKNEVDVLSFDVRNLAEVKENLENIKDKLGRLDVLVNNAGLAAGFDRIQDGKTEDWDTMIDTNIKGLLYITKQIVPYFIERGKGQIINIASTAAKVVYEKGNVYCATKFAVDALSKSMRIDLLPHGIKVTQVSPGAAETEFSMVRFKGDKDLAKKTYEGYQPLTGVDVASAIYYTATLPDHVCINELEITALAQANSTHVFRK